MTSAEVKIINESGLHLRPAGVLTQTCIRFKSEIILYYGERKIIGKSVLNVMAAGVKKGSTVRVECSGIDEEEALKAVVEAISSGLGEGTSTPEPLFESYGVEKGLLGCFDLYQHVLSYNSITRFCPIIL